MLHPGRCRATVNRHYARYATVLDIDAHRKEVSTTAPCSRSSTTARHDRLRANIAAFVSRGSRNNDASNTNSSTRHVVAMVNPQGPRRTGATSGHQVTSNRHRDTTRAANPPGQKLRLAAGFDGRAYPTFDLMSVARALSTRMHAPLGNPGGRRRRLGTEVSTIQLLNSPDGYALS